MNSVISQVVGKWAASGFALALLLSMNVSFAEEKPQAAATPPPKLDPRVFYFIGGEVIGPRGFAVGDAQNWNVPLVDKRAVSKGGMMKVYPEDFRAKDDALVIKTNGKGISTQLILAGPPTSLDNVKDLASLTFIVKVTKKPNKEVKLFFDCGWPCRAEVSINKILRKQPKGEWLSLPVPLNCFKGETFDWDKITGVFALVTEAKMEISIADIRIERLPEGEKGCVD